MEVSPKVILRLPRLSDVDIMLEWENAPENKPHTSHDRVYSRKDIIHLVENNTITASNNQVRFIICNAEDSIILGAIDLYDIDKAHKSAGVGILIDKAHRRKGFALSAIRSLADFSKFKLGLKLLYCEISEKNKPSAFLFEKAGFERVAFRKNHFVINSMPVDVYFYKKILA